MVDAHADRPRHYHTIEHVLCVLDRFDEVARDVGWDAPREVALAIVYHDAVYVAGRGDNEAQSAALAEREIGRWLPKRGIDVRRVAGLIELTASHGQLDPNVLDGDASHFLDADMAVLGSEPRVYARYHRGVRSELAGVYGEGPYIVGRARFLEGLLAGGRIFLSAYFSERLEASARRNIAGELEALRASVAASAASKT